jgi:hypothetical protein
MIPEATGHLSEEALNDILIGMGSSDAEEHLASCHVCREKVEAFHAGLVEFNQTTLAWSEERSNALPRITARPRPQLVPHSFRGWALAAAVLMAVAIPLLRYKHPPLSNEPTAQVSSSEDSETQITQDNELLNAVNVAINEDNKSLKNVNQLLEGPHPRVETRPE